LKEDITDLGILIWVVGMCVYLAVVYWPPSYHVVYLTVSCNVCDMVNTDIHHLASAHPIHELATAHNNP